MVREDAVAVDRVAVSSVWEEVWEPSGDQEALPRGTWLIEGVVQDLGRAEVWRGVAKSDEVWKPDG